MTPDSWEVTAGLAENSGSLPPDLTLQSACVSLWEVMAAHHRVHDYACCHLQADCLESWISSGPLRSTACMGTFTFTFIIMLMTWSCASVLSCVELLVHSFCARECRSWNFESTLVHRFWPKIRVSSTNDVIGNIYYVLRWWYAKQAYSVLFTWKNNIK